jgi:hypothetical protein
VFARVRISLAINALTPPAATVGIDRARDQPTAVINQPLGTATGKRQHDQNRKHHATADQELYPPSSWSASCPTVRQIAVRLRLSHKAALGISWLTFLNMQQFAVAATRSAFTTAAVPSWPRAVGTIARWCA